MSKLSDEMRKAFDADIRDEAGDPSLLTMVGDVFRSRQRVSMVASVIAGTILMGVWIWTIVAFFQAEGQKETLAWLGAFLFLALMIAFMKVWFWMQMQRFAILREIKRLELEVARLRAESESQ